MGRCCLLSPCELSYKSQVASRRAHTFSQLHHVDGEINKMTTYVVQPQKLATAAAVANQACPSPQRRQCRQCGQRGQGGRAPPGLCHCEGGKWGPGLWLCAPTSSAGESRQGSKVTI